MTKYVTMTEALRKATKNSEASDQFVQALEEHEMDRKAEYDRLFAQMRQDNAKFIDIVERELQLQSRQLRFLSWAIPVATGVLALLIIVFNAIN